MGTELPSSLADVIAWNHAGFLALQSMTDVGRDALQKVTDGFWVGSVLYVTVESEMNDCLTNLDWQNVVVYAI